MGQVKSLLIDLNAEKPTRGKQAKAVQPERLSEENYSVCDRLVCDSLLSWEMNHEKLAEMASL
jgi:hypothetical protein